MSDTQPQRRRPWAIAGQVVAIVIVAAAAAGSVFVGALLLDSRLGPASNDPHGYALVFGTLFLVPTSFVGALALPFVVPGRQRRARKVAGIGAVGWVVVALLLAGFALGG